MKSWMVLALAVGCPKAETPKYHWDKSPSGWALRPIDGSLKGTVAFDQRTDNTIGLTAHTPKGTEIRIGSAAPATFEGGESIVMLDISKSLGAAPVSMFAEDNAADDRHPAMTTIPVSVRFPDSDDAFSTTLVQEVARPSADGLLDRMLKGPIGFADEIANDPADTALVVFDTNYDAHFERTVKVRGPGTTLAQVDWIAYLDHVAAGNHNCGSYSDGRGAPTEMLMVFHATRVRLFDRRKGTLLGTTTAKGKQTCPKEITVSGIKAGDLPVVWSGGSDVFDGGDEALAWLDKQLAKLARG